MHFSVFPQTSDLLKLLLCAIKQNTIKQEPLFNLIREGKPADLHPQNLTVKFPFEVELQSKNLIVAPSAKTL